MNVFDFLTQLILSQQSALAAGIIAGLTPCTLVMIPLFLYRFGIWQGNDKQQSILWKELGQLLVGFLLSFFLTGIVFQSLFASDFVNVLRLVLGTLLIFAGLALIGKSLSLQFFTQITQPFALGLVIPWILSFSPCVLPWVAIILIDQGSFLQFDVLGKFLLFGFGMLIPALTLALLGRLAWRSAQKLSRVLYAVEKFTPLLLILAGFYLSVQLLNLTAADTFWTGFILVLVILIYAGFVFRSESRRTLLNIQLFVVLIVFALGCTVVAFQLAHPFEVRIFGQELLNACIAGMETNSPVATEIALLFNSVGVGLGVWSWLINRLGMRVKFVL